ncbi:MAG: hypothetical protein ABID87_06890 [Chloroflexota bacterium]
MADPATINPGEVLKWVALVFAAGFVGYFGRYLGMLIIDRLRRKRDRQTADNPAGTGTEKKRLKAMVKQAKKAGKEKSG